MAAINILIATVLEFADDFAFPEKEIKYII